MAEIKPISTLSSVGAIADGDQLVINVKQGATDAYITSVISPTDFGSQIGSYLTIPYLPTDGGQINGKLQIDPGGTESIALEIGTASGGAGNSTFTRNGQIKISGDGNTPWLDLEASVNQAWDAAEHAIVFQVTNYSIPVFAVHEQGYTEIRGSVVVGDTSVNGSNIPGYIKTIANTNNDGLNQSSDKAFTVQYDVTSVAEIDYTGHATFNSTQVGPNFTITSSSNGDGGYNAIQTQAGSGSLTLRTKTFALQDIENANASWLNTTSNAEISLFYNGGKRFETTATGATVTGSLTSTTGASFVGDVTITGDTVIGVEGSPGTGSLTVPSGIMTTIGGQVNFNQTGGNQSLVVGDNFGFYQTVGNIGSQPIIMLDYATCELYWQGAKKLETTTDGVDVTGKLITSGIDSNGQYNILPGGEFFKFANTGAWHLTYDHATQQQWHYSIDANKDYVRLYAGEPASGDDWVLEVTSTGVDVTGDMLVNGMTVGLGGGAEARNTCVGKQALNANVNGDWAVAVGQQALSVQTSGDSNTAVGYWALSKLTTGDQNTGLGRNAGNGIVSGEKNVAIGYQSLYNADDDLNTAVGTFAGYYIEGGSNTILGAYQGTAADSTLNDTVIISAGETERIRCDSTGNWSSAGDISAPNITAINTALTAIKAAAEDASTDLAGLKAAIATALASF